MIGRLMLELSSFTCLKLGKVGQLSRFFQGGIENRTSVKVRSTATGPKRRGKPDDGLIRAPKGEPAKSSPCLPPQARIAGKG